MTGCFPSEENIRANCTCKCHRLPNNIGCTECKCKPYFGKNNHAPNFHGLTNLFANLIGRVDNIARDVKDLQIHKNKQIDENRAVSKHLDKLDIQDGNGHSLLSGRIDALTEMYKELSLMCVRHDDNIRSIDKRVSKIEAQNQEFFDANPIAVIEKRIDQIGANLKLLSDLHDVVSRSLDMVRVIDRDKPHVCPVCDGCGNSKGQIEPNPNYEFSMKYASCHSCEGKGVLWG